MKRKYETKLYRDPTKFLLAYVVAILMIIGALIYLGRLYNSKLLGFWLPMLVVILPFFLSRAVKSKFIERKAVLEFDTTTFSVSVFLTDINTLLSQESFLWSEIVAFKFYFDTKSNTCLTIWLVDKTRRTFIFKDNKTFDEAIINNSVFSNFFFYAKELYQNGKKIKIRTSLLATKTGQMIICGEIVLIIVAFILHLVKNNFSNSFYLIFAVILLIPQVFNSIQNKSVYEKMTGLLEKRD